MSLLDAAEANRVRDNGNALLATKDVAAFNGQKAIQAFDSLALGETHESFQT